MATAVTARLIGGRYHGWYEQLPDHQPPQTVIVAACPLEECGGRLHVHRTDHWRELPAVGTYWLDGDDWRLLGHFRRVATYVAQDVEGDLAVLLAEREMLGLYELVRRTA